MEVEEIQSGTAEKNSLTYIGTLAGIQFTPVRFLRSKISKVLVIGNISKVLVLGNRVARLHQSGIA